MINGEVSDLNRQKNFFERFSSYTQFLNIYWLDRLEINLLIQFRAGMDFNLKFGRSLKTEEL